MRRFAWASRGASSSRLLARGGALLLRCALVTSLSLSVSTPATATATAADPAEAEAKALFEHGQAQFETADYEGAIESFTRAYEAARRIEDGQFRAVVSATLQFNLAGAHIKAYEINDEPKHLEQARVLLRRYSEREALDEEERASAAQLLTRVEELIAALPEPEPPPSDRDPDEPPPAEQPVPKDSNLGRGLIIAGAVATGLSLAGLGLMTGGLVIGDAAVDEFLAADNGAGRTAAIDRGRRGNTLAIAGGVLGGTLLVAGVSLLAVGATRARPRAVAVRPALAPGLVGLHLSGSF